jgi:hypothetical protein
VFDDPLSPALLAFIALIACAYVPYEIRRRRPDSAPPVANRSAASSDWIVILAVVPAFAGMLWLLKASSRETIHADIDMTVSRGQLAQVYFNEQWAKPIRASLDLNAHRKYRFDGLPDDISYLRLDPANAAGARVVLCDIAIWRGPVLLHRFSIDEIRKWTFVETSNAVTENGCLVFQTTTTGGRLFTNMNVSAGARSALLIYLAAAVRNPHVFALGFTGAFLLFLLAGLTRRAFLADATAVALTAAAAFPVAWLAMHLPSSPPPIAQAVGMSSYLGHSKFVEHLASVFLLALAVAAGWAANRIRGVSAAATPGAGDHGTSRVKPAWVRWTVHVLVLLVLAAMFQPNLPAALEQLKHQTFGVQQWDSVGYMTWWYFVAAGRVPGRDFWYPYAGTYMHTAPFPVAHIEVFLYTVTILWLLYLGIAGLVGGRLRRGLALFGVVLIPVVLNIFFGWTRYLLCVLLVLWYLRTVQAKRPRFSTSAALAFVSGLVFFYEPAQFMYASAAIALYIVLSIPRPIPRPIRARQIAVALLGIVKQQWLIAGVPLATGIAAATFIFAVNGMLGGVIAFYRSMDVQSIYGAWPAPVDNWAIPLLRFETVFLLSMLLIAAAARRWFAEKDEGDPALTALLLLGATTFLVFQKLIVRPHIWDSVQMFPFLMLVIYVLGVWRRKTIAQGIVAGCFAGCALAMAVNQGTAGWMMRMIAGSPRTAAANADFLVHGAPGAAHATLDLFTPERLTGFVDENSALHALASRYGMTSTDKIFVLGDDSLLYVLRRQDSPYMINLYNSSPVDEQERTVRWLEQNRPRFVVWDPHEASFDWVPNVVRTPLIYRYVVDHYAYLGTSGRFHLLGLRTAGAVPDFAYWRHALGPVVHMGHLPAISRLSDYPECRAGRSPCTDVLVVHFGGAEPPEESKATVKVETSGGPMELRFDVERGRRDYVFNLGRQWFWGIARPANPAASMPDRGAQVRIERRAQRPILY